LNEWFPIEEKWYVCTWYPSHRAKMQNEREQVAIKAGYESAVPVWFNHLHVIPPTAELIEYHSASPAEVRRINRQFETRSPHGLYYCVLSHLLSDGSRKTWKHS